MSSSTGAPSSTMRSLSRRLNTSACGLKPPSSIFGLIPVMGVRLPSARIQRCRSAVLRWSDAVTNRSEPRWPRAVGSAIIARHDPRPSDSDAWTAARLPTSVNHLDSAAAGRSSRCDARRRRGARPTERPPRAPTSRRPAAATTLAELRGQRRDPARRRLRRRRVHGERRVGARHRAAHLAARSAGDGGGRPIGVGPQPSRVRTRRPAVPGRGGRRTTA